MMHEVRITKTPQIEEFKHKHIGGPPSLLSLLIFKLLLLANKNDWADNFIIMRQQSSPVEIVAITQFEELITNVRLLARLGFLTTLEFGAPRNYLFIVEKEGLNIHVEEYDRGWNQPATLSRNVADSFRASKLRIHPPVIPRGLYDLDVRAEMSPTTYVRNCILAEFNDDLAIRLEPTPVARA